MEFFGPCGASCNVGNVGDRAGESIAERPYSMTGTGPASAIACPEIVLRKLERNAARGTDAARTRAIGAFVCNAVKLRQISAASHNFVIGRAIVRCNAALRSGPWGGTLK